MREEQTKDGVSETRWKNEKWQETYREGGREEVGTAALPVQGLRQTRYIGARMPKHGPRMPLEC